MKFSIISFAYVETDSWPGFLSKIVPICRQFCIYNRHRTSLHHNVFIKQLGEIACDLASSTFRIGKPCRVGLPVSDYLDPQITIATRRNRFGEAWCCVLHSFLDFPMLDVWLKALDNLTHSGPCFAQVSPCFARRRFFQHGGAEGFGEWVKTCQDMSRPSLGPWFSPPNDWTHYRIL